jgi:hypothetical protein
LWRSIRASTHTYARSNAGNAFSRACTLAHSLRRSLTHTLTERLGVTNTKPLTHTATHEHAHGRRYNPVHIARHGAFIVPQVANESPADGISAQVTVVNEGEHLPSRYHFVILSLASVLVVCSISRSIHLVIRDGSQRGSAIAISLSCDCLAHFPLHTPYISDRYRSISHYIRLRCFACSSLCFAGGHMRSHYVTFLVPRFGHGLRPAQRKAFL